MTSSHLFNMKSRKVKTKKHTQNTSYVILTPPEAFLRSRTSALSCKEHRGPSLPRKTNINENELLVHLKAHSFMGGTDTTNLMNEHLRIQSRKVIIIHKKDPAQKDVPNASGSF